MTLRRRVSMRTYYDRRAPDYDGGVEGAYRYFLGLGVDVDRDAVRAERDELTRQLLRLSRGVSVDVAAVAVVTAGSPDAASAGAVAVAPSVPDRPAGWWRAWRDRFGLAEVCGTLAAVAGFAAGYAQAGSLLAAAALATVGEAIGFYGCIAVKTGAAARRATIHLGGWRRLAAGAWHAVHEQLASCAVAETFS